MFKNRVFLVVAAIFLLNFYANNVSFAIDNNEQIECYPDYACVFSGKDTCEKFNRKLFVFNLKLNKYVLRPVNIVWASIMPQYGMDRLLNAYNNINFPTRLLGCLLQKDFKSTKQEALRFFINTTIGVGGLYDPAKTRFKIQPHQEDMEQVLAHYKVKLGPYLVLPVVRGNIRDLAGKLLDCPLRPTSYVGPFGAAATALFAVNNSTYAQPFIKKIDETYADPYEMARQVDGISMYIKNLNLDREEVFKEKTAAQNIIKVNDFAEVPKIKPDIEMANFNPQGSLTDSMRTAYFDNQKIDNSKWAEVSIWNKNFSKQLKTGSVNLNADRPNYKYRYILQKNKTSRLAIIYPSIGDGITSDKSMVLAKILFEEGFSVLIQGSTFNWEFIKSMPVDYRPGIPAKDADYLRMVTAKIIDDIQIRSGKSFNDKILVGCSFGALTSIFVAAKEDNENTLGISKYIAINPPIDLFFALKQLDKYAQDWKKDPSDIKMRTAIAAEKIIQVSNAIYHKDIESMPESLPFTEDESKQIVGFIMKQKLYDVVFAIENCSRGKKNDLSETINKISFNDYAEKYLLIRDYKDSSQFQDETSLYSLTNFLRKSKNYKIYQTLDDYFVNQEQLDWLKQQSNDRALLFSNGSHLGWLYRKEFLTEFKKDIKLQDPAQAHGL